MAEQIHHPSRATARDNGDKPLGRNFAATKMPILPASFIRGSALWRDVAALFNPRCSHDDPIFPRGRDRFCMPVPDRLRFRADAGAGDPCRQDKAAGGHSAASLECSRRPTPRDCTARSAEIPSSARRPRLTSRSDFVLLSFLPSPCRGRHHLFDPARRLAGPRWTISCDRRS